MSAVPLLVVIVAVMTGAALQRLSGTGLALVTAPILSVLLGPVSGILTVNLCSVISSAMLLPVVRAEIAWSKYRLLAPAALVGAVPGAWLAVSLPTRWLNLAIGVSVVVALSVTVLVRPRTPARGRAPTVLAGSLSGLMNATAGVATPALTVYALASRWPHRSFAATLQPFFLTVATGSLLLKLPTADFGALSWSVLAAAVFALPTGIAVAGFLRHKVDADRARRFAIILACLGALAAIVRAVLTG